MTSVLGPILKREKELGIKYSFNINKMKVSLEFRHVKRDKWTRTRDIGQEGCCRCY